MHWGPASVVPTFWPLLSLLHLQNLTKRKLAAVNAGEHDIYI